MEDLEIFRKAASALRAGENIALVTVIATTGSTPGKVGYKMLVCGHDGETVGTVGGGLTEAQMIETARRMLPGLSSEAFRFDLGGTQDNEKGICGGSVEFLIETFDRSSLPLFDELSAAIAQGQSGVLISIVSPGKSPEKTFLTDIDQIDTVARFDFSPEMITLVRELAAQERHAEKLSDGGLEVFVETFAEQPMVFVFGAGHLADHICRYAKSLNFGVTVCDDREQYANPERFPDADHIVVEDFERVFDKVHIDGDSYIIIVTRGHKFDEIVLERAVRTGAKYIGMIGSKRKTLTILKRLSEKGIAKKVLTRVYSPIGVSIGAVTPEEIALSIVCELIKIRRLGHGPGIDHMTVCCSEELYGSNT